MRDYSKAFISLLEGNMGLKQGERLLVFSDIIRPDEALSPAESDRRARLLAVARDLATFASARYGNTDFVTFPSTAASGAEPPLPLWEAALGESTTMELSKGSLVQRLMSKTADQGDIENAARIVKDLKESVVDVVVALANNSTSHTRFRSLVNKAGGRFASLPHFDPEMFFSSMMVDWTALAERTRRLESEINRAEAIMLTTPNGTRMHFTKGTRMAAGDDGILTKPGSFGNLPAGEVYLAPVEGMSAGVMVIDYAPTHKLASPLQLTVEKGLVTSVTGDDPYRSILETKLRESEFNRNIAELGIGTNDRATRPDNVLEAEKILGTVHIALGDNSGFGGTVQTPFHEDYVFYNPTLTLISKDGTEWPMIRDGKPLF